MKGFVALAFVLLAACGALGCDTASDCYLNGLCQGGNCLCDAPWGGANCSVFNFQPAPMIGAYGYSPNVTSWGGLPVFLDNLYHLLVTEIILGCGLCTWEHNSRIIHATSKTLLGPYTFEDVALPVWSHNPQIVVDYSSGTPIYLLFHIGSADANGGWVNCTKNGTGTFVKANKSHSREASSDILHTAPSPYGPWTPQNPPGLMWCNNPAPYVFPNGSILLICSQGGNNSFFAPSWKGPWTVRQIIWAGNPGAGIWEDPFIWRDKRGVFKMIAHVYPSSGPHFYDRISGFGYSHDGITWTRMPFQPYTSEVLHTNGKTVLYTTRERPKIFFDKDGTPLALFTGVAQGENCWDCKQSCPVSWTFNLAQAFAL